MQLGSDHFGLPNEVWLNDGHGDFTDSGQRLGASESYSVKLGDLDGDGDLDTFVTNANRQPSEVWLNDGRGTFADSGQRLANRHGYGVALDDLDHDGDLDAFVVGGDSQVWLNNGVGNFSLAQTFTHSGSSAWYDVALGDVDADGDLDAFIANPFGSQVFLNEDVPTDVSLPAGGGNYELLVNNGDLVLRIQGGAEILRQGLEATPKLVINGSAGYDKLIVDLSGGNPIRTGGALLQRQRKGEPWRLAGTDGRLGHDAQARIRQRRRGNGPCRRPKHHLQRFEFRP
jgi:VCBS repeat protein